MQGYFLNSVLLLIVASSCSNTVSIDPQATLGNSVKTISYTISDTLINGTNYRLFLKENAQLKFYLARPDSSDTSILLSVPAAYTDLHTLGVDGLCIREGEVFNKDSINPRLGGGVIITNDTIRILSTEYGRVLTDSFINVLSERKVSFFQQTICVIDGKAENFRDQKNFQRRGLIKLENGNVAIVESIQSITLRKFSEDMASIGTSQLLNLDMGAWDEGWYREPVSDKVKVLGRNRSQTHRQTNWLVFTTNL